GVRSGVTDHVHQPSGDRLRRPGPLDGDRQRDHGGDHHHDGPVHSLIRLPHGHHPGEGQRSHREHHRDVGETTELASIATIPNVIRSALVDPGPRGSTWRRTCEGGSTSRASDGSKRSRASHVPRSRTVSPGRSPVCSVVMFWPSRCTASTTKSPLEVVSPGKTCSPTMGERGGIISSTTPVWRSISVSAPNEGL